VRCDQTFLRYAIDCQSHLGPNTSDTSVRADTATQDSGAPSADAYFPSTAKPQRVDDSGHQARGSNPCMASRASGFRRNQLAAQRSGAICDWVTMPMPRADGRHRCQLVMPRVQSTPPPPRAAPTSRASSRLPPSRPPRRMACDAACTVPTACAMRWNADPMRRASNLQLRHGAIRRVPIAAVARGNDLNGTTCQLHQPTQPSLSTT